MPGRVPGDGILIPQQYQDRYQPHPEGLCLKRVRFHPGAEPWEQPRLHPHQSLKMGLGKARIFLLIRSVGELIAFTESTWRIPANCKAALCHT